MARRRRAKTEATTAIAVKMARTKIARSRSLYQPWRGRKLTGFGYSAPTAPSAPLIPPEIVVPAWNSWLPQPMNTTIIAHSTGRQRGDGR